MSRTPTAPAGKPPRPGPGPADPRRDPPWVLALPASCGLLLLAWAFALLRGAPGLFGAFVAAGALLLGWTAALALGRARSGGGLELTVAVHKHHWVQALAQLTVFLWWGWHVRSVYAFLPLVAAQVVFAYGVDALLAWSRRGRWALGFGPFPVIFSINLFLWLRPEYFVLQFGMILLGYLGKDLIRWSRDGRSAHIFNPSSFPLAVLSVILILTGTTDITLGQFIATSQYYPPNMYLVIFLAALPGQILFGVARMTLPAVVTAFAISAVHLELTGTYLFFDSHIPVPVFLGMHLLFTDPSTSPRSEPGRILFGVLYGGATSLLYVALGGLGIPTFYDKLLPVPVLNLMVRRIDALTSGPRAGPISGARQPPAPATRRRRNLAYTGVWALTFAGLSAVEGVGDNHPGQALPFWWEVCREGNNERACDYAVTMTNIYCGDGSGWACNEVGVLAARSGRRAPEAFQRACDLGFDAGCRNLQRMEAGAGPEDMQRAPPAMADLPILLRGTKQPLTVWSEEALLERACAHGWDEVCGA